MVPLLLFVLRYCTNEQASGARSGPVNLTTATDAIEEAARHAASRVIARTGGSPDPRHLCLACAALPHHLPLHLDEVAARLMEIADPADWQTGVALAALAEARHRLGPRTDRELRKWSMACADVVSASSDPVTALAWAYCLVRWDIHASDNTPATRLAEPTTVRSQCFPSGMLREYDADALVPDLTRTILAGVLGMLVALRTENPGGLATARANLAAVARLIATSGAFVWPVSPRPVHRWLAALGLAMMASLTGNGVYQLRARHLLATSRRGKIGMADADLLLASSLWREWTYSGAGPAESGSLPTFGSYPDAGTGICHDACVSFGWQWCGSCAPVIMAAPAESREPLCGGIVPHAVPFDWTLRAPVTEEEKAAIVADHRVEEASIEWRGELPILDEAWLPLKGKITPQSIAVEFGRACEEVGWALVVPEGLTIEVRQGERRALINSARGAILDARWDGSVGILRPASDGREVCLAVTPLPSSFVMTLPDAVGDKVR